MPIELGIWKLGEKTEKISFSKLELESKLEDTLVKDISILSSNFMLIGRQILTAQGKYIDLLSIDGDGNLIVIELKRDRTPRDCVAQLLDYASWVQTLSYENIKNIYSEKNDGKAFEKGFAETFSDLNPPDELNKELQLILVAAELDHSSERIINYLSDNFGVPINAVFFRYFRENNNDYITRTWFIDPKEAEEKKENFSSKKGQELWNGRDYYCCFGSPERRSWDDARKFGFISGGGGQWYSRTLSKLSLGDRVFVHIPNYGYVGVGEVNKPSVPIKEFLVNIEDKQIPIAEVNLKNKNILDDQDDNQLSEFVVGIKWGKTYDQNNAYWEKGMFANQNTVTKLRSKFTLDLLIKHFELKE